MTPYLFSVKPIYFFIIICLIISAVFYHKNNTDYSKIDEDNKLTLDIIRIFMIINVLILFITIFQIHNFTFMFVFKHNLYKLSELTYMYFVLTFVIIIISSILFPTSFLITTSSLICCLITFYSIHVILNILYLEDITKVGSIIIYYKIPLAIKEGYTYGILKMLLDNIIVVTNDGNRYLSTEEKAFLFKQVSATIINGNILTKETMNVYKIYEELYELVQHELFLLKVFTKPLRLVITVVFTLIVTPILWWYFNL